VVDDGTVDASAVLVFAAEVFTLPPPPHALSRSEASSAARISHDARLGIDADLFRPQAQEGADV
jgi:hypothetical protein